MKKNIFKKSLVTLGGITGVVAPLATVVACGDSSASEVKHFKLLPTYTGQADQLIALGIKPDYYPLQLDAKEPFGYLINPSN